MIYDESDDMPFCMNDTHNIMTHSLLCYIQSVVVEYSPCKLMGIFFMYVKLSRKLNIV
jgi:hypothetical protein